jgi:hypothetical protein
VSRLLLGLGGLLTGAVLSTLIGACCGSPTKLQSGTYAPTDSSAEADYRLTIAADISTVTETFTRNGVSWEIDYTAGPAN